jgi:hypothetical protein
MVKSAENRMRSNLERLPVINVKSRPRYISALNKVVPDISQIFISDVKFAIYLTKINIYIKNRKNQHLCLNQQKTKTMQTKIIIR